MVQIITTLCDIHDKRGEAVKADAGTVPLTFGKRSVEVDLCTECEERYAAPLEEVFEVGRRPGKAAQPVSRNGAAATPAKKPAATPGTARDYLRDQPNSPDGMYVCRWDGECDRKVSTPENPGFPTSQGRGMHERRAHDFNLAGKDKRVRVKA